MGPSVLRTHLGSLAGWGLAPSRQVRPASVETCNPHLEVRVSPSAMAITLLLRGSTATTGMAWARALRGVVVTCTAASTFGAVSAAAAGNASSDKAATTADVTRRSIDPPICVTQGATECPVRAAGDLNRLPGGRQ
jgi:hypothetical protein